nr:hypothetical protein [Cryptosporangium arvum]
MVDRLRAEQARRAREQRVLSEPVGPEPAADDGLTPLALCCHPALSSVSRVALTLRAVGGLTTTEHAHGTNEATMATRLSRPKQQLTHTNARGAHRRVDARPHRPAADRGAVPGGGAAHPTAPVRLSRVVGVANAYGPRSQPP